jgi:hypothetical protein
MNGALVMLDGSGGNQSEQRKPEPQGAGGFADDLDPDIPF